MVAGREHKAATRLQVPSPSLGVFLMAFQRIPVYAVDLGGPFKGDLMKASLPGTSRF